jgi:hypothetical protein
MSAENGPQVLAGRDALPKCLCHMRSRTVASRDIERRRAHEFASQGIRRRRHGIAAFTGTGGAFVQVRVADAGVDGRASPSAAEQR